MERDTLVGRANALLDRIRSRAEKTERNRRVPAETVEELKAAGLFRALQPKRCGGLEATPEDFFGAVIAIASACPSTAWILAIMVVHTFEFAQLSVEAQDDIFGDDPDQLIASSYAPRGEVTSVPGGYRLSGRYTSASGVDHATWVVVGGNVPEGRDHTPTLRTFAVPKSDYRILDDWHVMGLSGTGSKSVVLDDVFVPAHRSLRRSDIQARAGPGLAVNTAPLYRLPQGLIYLVPGAAPALGATKGAYAEFLGQIKRRVRRPDGSPMSEDPFVQRRLADASSTIYNLEHRVMRDLREMMDIANAGPVIPSEAIARWTWTFTRAADECVNATRGIFETLGSSAIYSSNPLQRYYRDILTMRQHGTQNPDRGALLVAQAELGID